MRYNVVRAEPLAPIFCEPLLDHERIDNGEREESDEVIATSRQHKGKSRGKISCVTISFSCLLILLVVASAALFIPVNVHVSSSTSPDEVLLVGNETQLAVSSDSWNSDSCSWKWELPSSKSKKGKSMTYVIDEESRSATVDVTCENMLGQEIGRGDISINGAVVRENVTVVDNSMSSLITSCPNVENSSIGINISSYALLTMNNILYSSACSGFIIRLATAPDEMTGMAYYTNASLEDVFLLLSIPSVDIPFVLMSSNATDGTSRLPSMSVAGEGKTYTIIDETNFPLSVKVGLFSGVLMFERLKWGISTSLKQLKYENGKFKGVTWHAQTSMRTKFEFTASISGGKMESKTLTLFSMNSWPVVIPVPLLDILVVNTDWEIQAKVSTHNTIWGDDDSKTYEVTWTVDAMLDCEWEVVCDKDSLCSGSTIDSSFHLLHPLRTSTSSIDPNDATDSSYLNIEVDLVVEVGLQFDEVVALNNQMSLGLVVDAPTAAEVQCPIITLQISDGVAVSVRLFTLDIFPHFVLPVYTGELLSFPVAAECLVPTSQPSTSISPSTSPYIPTCSFPPNYYSSLLGAGWMDNDDNEGNPILNFQPNGALVNCKDNTVWNWHAYEHGLVVTFEWTGKYDGWGQETQCFNVAFTYKNDDSEYYLMSYQERYPYEGETRTLYAYKVTSIPENNGFTYVYDVVSICNEQGRTCDGGYYCYSMN